MQLSTAISELNLFCAQARALELLEAWRADDHERVTEIRAELLGAYGMYGCDDYTIWQLVKWCMERGL